MFLISLKTEVILVSIKYLLEEHSMIAYLRGKMQVCKTLWRTVAHWLCSYGFTRCIQ